MVSLPRASAFRPHDNYHLERITLVTVAVHNTRAQYLAHARSLAAIDISDFIAICSSARYKRNTWAYGVALF
jgi:hypothetical protein